MGSQVVETGVGRRGDLARRVMGAAIGMPVVIGALVAPSPVLAVGSAVLAALAAAELARMGEGVLRRDAPGAATWAGLLAAAATAMTTALAHTAWLAPAMGLLVATATLVALWRRPDELPGEAALLLAAAVYVGAPLGCFAALRVGDEGIGWAALALVATWVGDTGSYAVGRLFGRSPLAPRLSPAKTVEGAVAGVGVAMVGGALVGWWLLGSIEPWQAAVLGGLANVLGQFGDLVESGLKRRAGVKDSGTVMAAFGGALDKIDSLLFAAPLLLGAKLLLS